MATETVERIGKLNTALVHCVLFTVLGEFAVKDDDLQWKFINLSNLVPRE